jgi:hypothetical protein
MCEITVICEAEGEICSVLLKAKFSDCQFMKFGVMFGFRVLVFFYFVMNA